MTNVVTKWLAVASLLVAFGAATASTQARQATPVGTPRSGTPSAGLDFDRIEREVAAQRQLSIATEIVAEVVDSAQVRAELEEEFRTELPPAEVAAIDRTFTAFGLLSPEVDLERLYLDLLTEQVAGRYFTDSGRLYVVAEGGELGPLQEATYAHEVVHALQDQRLGLDRLDARIQSADDDEDLAIAALVEGDATVAQDAYIGARPDLAAGVQSAYAGGEINTAVLERTPPILTQLLIFPYVVGAGFVAELAERGGNAAIDAAFADPPVSTEQVMHPERYVARDQPIAVGLPDLGPALGDGWSLVRENVFGEFQTVVLLIGNETEPTEQMFDAAEGWGGDRYQVWGNGDQNVVAWQTVWESEADAAEFAAELETAAARAGTPTAGTPSTLVAQAGSVVGFVTAPTPELAEAVGAALAANPPTTPAATPTG